MTDDQLADFKVALAVWIDAAVEHVRPTLTRFVVCDQFTGWQLNDDGYYRRLTGTRCYWALASWPNREAGEELQSLATYQALLETARQTPPLDRMFDNFVGTRSRSATFDFFAVVAVAALPDPVSVANGQPYSTDELVQQVVARVTADELAITTVSYLQGVALGGECLELEPGLTIERLTPSEVIDGLRLRFLTPEIEDLPMYIPRDGMAFGLKKRTTVPRIIGERPPLQIDAVNDGDAAIRPASERLLEGLALLTDQTVRVVGVVTPIRDPLATGEGFSYQPYPASQVRTVFQLDEDRCHRLRQIWNRPSLNSRQGKALDLAIRRLSLAIQRTLWEDRLLDLFIAAEAFYLTDVSDAKEKGELKYRLALRAAVWSDGVLEGWTKREVYAHMRRGYDVRSSIVHGSAAAPKDIKVKGEQVDLRAFVQATEEILRAALQKGNLSRHRPRSPFDRMGRHDSARGVEAAGRATGRGVTEQSSPRRAGQRT